MQQLHTNPPVTAAPVVQAGLVSLIEQYLFEATHTTEQIQFWLAQHGISPDTTSFVLCQMVLQGRITVVSMEIIRNSELHAIVGVNCTYQLSEWNRLQLRREW
jgi:hypothetical protein